MISFAFKILLASILGGALNYLPGKSENNQNIVESSLICIFSASILGLTRQFSIEKEYFSMGIGVFAVIIGVILISKNLSFQNRIIWIFSAVVGMIIGSGLFFQALLLAGLIYLILHNSDTIFHYIDTETNQLNKSKKWMESV